MRDGTDTRVERTRSVGDVVDTGPGLVAAAVLARQRAREIRAASPWLPEHAIADAFDRFADVLAERARAA